MRRHKAIILATILIPVFLNADVGSIMRQGNALCRKGDYEEALKKYQGALVQEPDNTKIHYNIARALYKTGKFAEAASEYQLGLLTKDRKLQAQAFYNIGNCQFKQGQLDPAIESYTASLLIDPKDRDAKQNLEFCLKIKEQQKNQPQDDSTQQDQPQSQPQAEPQTKPGEISKDDANRILQALQNQEKENQRNKPEKVERERVEKDW